MKHALLCLLLSSSLVTFSQTYQLLPDSCTFCFFLRSDGGTTFSSGRYRIDPDRDTVLFGNTYLVLSDCDAFRQPVGLRQEGNKLYGIAADSTHEELIMDFDAEVGDTITNLYSELIYYDAVVVEKDSVLLNGGSYHAYMRLDGLRYLTPWSSEWAEDEWWPIEWNEKALCKEDGGVVYNVPFGAWVISVPYAWPDYCTTDPAYGSADSDVSCIDCVPWTSSLDEYEVIHMEISPNPANDQLILETDKPVDLVRIVDLNGVELLEQTMGKTTVKLYVGELRSGVYFVGVQSGNSWVWKRIIKL